MARWRMLYETRPPFDEPEGDASILIAPPNPKMVALFEGEKAIVGVHMTEALPHPILYRRYSITLNGSGTVQDGIVIGRASKDPPRVELWFWDGKLVVPCPNEHCDLGAVKYLLGEA